MDKVTVDPEPVLGPPGQRKEEGLGRMPVHHTAAVRKFFFFFFFFSSFIHKLNYLLFQ